MSSTTSTAGSLMERAHTAILDAYTYAELREVILFHLDQDLDTMVTKETSYRVQVLELLRYAKHNGSLAFLLSWLSNKRPQSTQLADVYNEANGLALENRHAASIAPLDSLPTDQVPLPATLPAGSCMPFAHNRLFVGRDDDLRRLATAFNQWEGGGIATVIICGIGGVGKSQLAVEFAHRYGRYFAGGVYWISFADAGAVTSEIANACGTMPDLPPGSQERDLPTQLRHIRAAWGRPLPRLLIFDNCEDVKLLEEWRPTTGEARVLLTCRRDRFAPSLGVHLLRLHELSRPNSVVFLQSILAAAQNGKQPSVVVSPEGDADLNALAEELGDLPLALHMAGSFLGNYARDITLARYLAQLRSIDPLTHRSLKQVFGHSPTKHELSIARTFAFSYERLDQSDASDRLALNMLGCAAYFACGEPIPRSLLIATLDLPGGDPDAPLQAADAIHRLTDLGLLSSNENDDPVLHRLIVRFVLSQLGNDAMQATVEETLLNEASRINESGDPRPLLAWRAHLSHTTELALRRDDERAASLADQLGYHLKMAGDLVGSKPYLERSLAIRQGVLGEQHLDTAVSLNNLGTLLQDLGNYVEAKPYLERSLAIWEQMLGEQHLDTAVSLNNLGTLLKDMGNYDEAKPYLERSLAVYEQKLGTQHQTTISGLNNLGNLLKEMGQYDESMPYLKRSLAICKSVLGDQHPSTATSLNNLGWLMQAKGDYDGAKPYYEQSLAICKSVLGDQHPSTATCLNNLGSLLQAVGNYEGAKPYYESSLVVREQVLGKQHPNTAQSLNNLGLLLKMTGDYDGAKSYLERSIAICEQVLGEHHPLTASSLHNMGSVLHAMNDYAGAESYYKRSLAICEEMLGEQHPVTTSSLNNLGRLLHAMGDFAGARSYLERAREAYTAQLGPEHPKTLAVQQMLDRLDELRAI